MGNKAINIKEQITRLQGRGMVMNLGETKAEEVLLDIGYYRFGFYWNPFEIDKEHNLKKGTKFSDVLDLYYLDVDLKNNLSRAINRIEINFKTKLIYYASLQYDTDPVWFINKSIVSEDYIIKFKNHYDKVKKNAKPIIKHHKKHLNHKYAYAWKTIEFLTFGTVITMYTKLYNTSLKQKIAEQFNIKSITVFENFLLTILFIRNICAHSDLLFDANTPKEIRTTPIIEFNKNNRHCLDSSIKVIMYLLNQISNDRHKDLKNDIDSLFNSHKNNPVLKDIIENKIGYEYI
jgi:abortive infection bacteriophage resistance protein